MSDQPTRHPALARALDRSLSLEERRAAIEEWDDEYGRHWHPGERAHSHAGGGRTHIHEKGSR